MPDLISHHDPSGDSSWTETPDQKVNFQILRPLLQPSSLNSSLWVWDHALAEADGLKYAILLARHWR